MTNSLSQKGLTVPPASRARYHGYSPFDESRESAEIAYCVCQGPRRSSLLYLAWIAEAAGGSRNVTTFHLDR